jgi:hypothetical protein
MSRKSLFRRAAIEMELYTWYPNLFVTRKNMRGKPNIACCAEHISFGRGLQCRRLVTARIKEGFLNSEIISPAVSRCRVIIQVFCLWCLVNIGFVCSVRIGVSSTLVKQ